MFFTQAPCRVSGSATRSNRSPEALRSRERYGTCPMAESSWWPKERAPNWKSFAGRFWIQSWDISSARTNPVGAKRKMSFADLKLRGKLRRTNDEVRGHSRYSRQFGSVPSGVAGHQRSKVHPLLLRRRRGGLQCQSQGVPRY